MTTRHFATFVLPLILTGLLLTPALDLPREGPSQDDPVVRIIKRLLHHSGPSTNEIIAVPKP